QGSPPHSFTVNPRYPGLRAVESAARTMARYARSIHRAAARALSRDKTATRRAEEISRVTVHILEISSQSRGGIPSTPQVGQILLCPAHVRLGEDGHVQRGTGGLISDAILGIEDTIAGTGTVNAPEEEHHGQRAFAL